MHYSPELARRIAQRHGLTGEVTHLPASGMVNEAWALGEKHILRITHQEECDGEADREAAVVPFVASRGIRTPALVAVNSTCDLAPRPYTIYERAPGTLLGASDREHAWFESTYREIGRQCALLHTLEVTEELRSHLRPPELTEPRKSLAKAADAGLVSPGERARTEAMVGDLEALVGERRELALIHWDIHPWNLLVDDQTGELTAIIDWGDAGIGDPAYDLASMPIEALPGMLAGYEETRRIGPDFVAACLLAGFALAFWEIRDLTEENGKRSWWRMPPEGPDRLIEDAAAVLGNVCLPR